MESIKVEVVAIVEVPWIYVSSFQAKLIVESDSKSIISWLSFYCSASLDFEFLFNKIKSLPFAISVKFKHIVRMTNGFPDSSSKQGMHRSLLFVAFTLELLCCFLLLLDSFLVQDFYTYLCILPIA